MPSGIIDGGKEVVLQKLSEMGMRGLLGKQTLRVDHTRESFVFIYRCLVDMRRALRYYLIQTCYLPRWLLTPNSGLEIDFLVNAVGDKPVFIRRKDAAV
jgi:hypothetical protein